MLCILYVIALSGALGVIAWLVEQTLPETAPRRWLWLSAVVLSVVIPGIYVTNHQAIVTHTAGARISAFDAEIRSVWLLVTVALALWAIAGALRLAGLLPPGGKPVIVHPTLGPATVGLLRPRVVVPAWVRGLPGEERRYVLQHEYEHTRAHDTQLLFFASLMIVIAPWNVALWWLVRRLSLAVEIDCDNRVLAGRGDPSRYGELLLKVAVREAPGARPRMQPAFLGGSGMLERRLRHLLAPTRLSRLQRLLALSIAGAVLIIALATPHPVLRAQVASHPQASSASR